jgi:hypothetical protein
VYCTFINNTAYCCSDSKTHKIQQAFYAITSWLVSDIKNIGKIQSDILNEINADTH